MSGKLSLLLLLVWLAPVSAEPLKNDIYPNLDHANLISPDQYEFRIAQVSPTSGVAYFQFKWKGEQEPRLWCDVLPDKHDGMDVLAADSIWTLYLRIGSAWWPFPLSRNRSDHALVLIRNRDYLIRDTHLLDAMNMSPSRRQRIGWPPGPVDHGVVLLSVEVSLDKYLWAVSDEFPIKAVPTSAMTKPKAGP